MAVKKLSKLEKDGLALMPEIVKATKAGSYLMIDPFVSDYLVAEGLVERNEEMKNEAGDLATRATEKGVSSIMAEENKPVVAAQVFEIEDVAIVVGKRGGAGREAKYPFDKLAVGQSFKVMPSADKPEPWISLQSTVSGATKRYAEEVKDEAGVVKTRTTRKGNIVSETKVTRKFVVTKEEKDGLVYARVGRVQ